MPSTSADLGDRPRERLEQLGAGALSDVELLALVIGHGQRNRSAAAMARSLLRHGGLRELARGDPQEWRSEPGVGVASAARLAALFEVARRLAAPAPSRGLVIRRPRDLGRHLMSRYGAERAECFGVVLLDGRNRFLSERVLSRGGWSASVVRPREVFRQSLLAAAPALVLFHNHPSGDPTPSREDVGITRQILQAGELLGIRVLDHLVVGAEGFVSFKERGLLGFP